MQPTPGLLVVPFCKDNGNLQIWWESQNTMESRRQKQGSRLRSERRAPNRNSSEDNPLFQPRRAQYPRSSPEIRSLQLGRQAQLEAVSLGYDRVEC